MAHYGELLKQAREKAGMSCRTVASKAGMSEAHLRFIEKGERDTKPQTLRKIAKIVGADETKLLRAWLHEHFQGADYDSILADLPNGFSFDELKSMYSIDEARKIFESVKNLTISEAKTLTPGQIIKLKLALQNALGLISELETVSKKC